MSGYGLVIACLAVAGTVLLLRAPRTPKPSSIQDRDGLATYLETVATSGAAPAVSVAVMGKDSALWEHSVGVANPFTQRPANANTAFH